MSYTLTLDMPERTTAYVMRRGARFHSEINALVLAFVAAHMQFEPAEAEDEVGQTRGESHLPGLAFVNALRGEGPYLDDGEMLVFNRIKDSGRKVELS